MKKIHLLCNAHLDPVWLWEKEDGIAEAISTFRVAAEFCENYDGFVFNHNESLLYEWVEEYEPALFERIKRLVADGKWHIMGGWYLQPDCVFPSGEGFLRQIEVGNDYFASRFGVKPTTAINFDPFGHSRGLVQILKKCGYDSYIFLRPFKIVPERDFVWRGFDGSEVIGHCMPDSYRTLKGMALERLKNEIADAHEGANLMLWGLGNHGGGPSKVDLEAINDFIKQHPEIQIIHSTPENYFSELDRDGLRVIDTSLVHCMVGCYTSMVRIKQAYRALENDLILTEKMLASSGIDYDDKMLSSAEKSMLFCQFHDILPGSMIKRGEEDSLRQMSFAREILAGLKMKSFMKLCEGQAKGKAGEIPVLVFNPNPYRVSEDIEVEFLLENQNWTENQVTVARVRDKNGNYLPTQNEKEDSSLTFDWVKRIAFRAELEPMSINRFDVELIPHEGSRRPIMPCDDDGECFVIKNDRMSVKINKKSGLIEKYEVDGHNYLNLGGRISVFKDNEDPWGMRVDGFYDRIGEFVAVSDEEANRFNGYPEESYPNVRVVDNGAMRTKIQAIFRSENSYAVITYTIPKLAEYIDVNVKILSNDVNRMYKLDFDTVFSDADFIGQTAFGSEVLNKNREVVMQKWASLSEGGRVFSVINQGTYGVSSDGSLVSVSLLRTPVYSAHPLENRPVCEHDFTHDHIDMGERCFNFRIEVNDEYIDKTAEIYNQPSYVLSFFPSGEGVKQDTSLEIDDGNVILSSYRQKKDGSYFLRLFNSLDATVNTTLRKCGIEYQITLAPYEIKAYVIRNNELVDSDIRYDEKRC
ncbi:MAG: glycoside hydrolase family 38 C-terminal domain-containing protein [Eubacteriales bacterium]|nr:glycoside hydrolase family 38 C-terminal domain-containing protein [Eubacteriales bacterium]